MKRILAALAGLVVLGASVPAWAQPAPCPDPEASSGLTVMFGVAAEFGAAESASSVGFTAKVLSGNTPNSFVLGAGVTYFPWAPDQKLGLDLSGGYLLPNVALLAGYDLLRQQLQVSGGWAPTADDEPVPPGTICAPLPP